ncbi:DUF934 domain-containing protein [Thioclava sp. BHET1]|nr:DUF934 domain-containing protein [Thioclava sp. BHET1]
MTQIVSKDGFVADQFADLERLAPEDYRPGAALALGPTADPGALAEQLSSAPLVEITVGGFGDGREFSIGALLRRQGYRGHLRACGPLLVDQFRALIRCGFDDIALPDEMAARQPEAQWRAVPFETGYRARLLNA